VRDLTSLTPERQAEIVHRFQIDCSSVYDMTREELEFLQMEFGEREHILDAMVKLHADTMDDDELLFARAQAIGCTVQDLLDFG